MNRRLGLTLLIALGVGTIAGLMCRPMIERGLAVHRLFSPVAQTRAKAVRWLLQPVRGVDRQPDQSDDADVDDDEGRVSAAITASRLSRYPDLARRVASRLAESGDEVFADACRVLHESGHWEVPVVGIEQWCRRLSLLLDGVGDTAAPPGAAAAAARFTLDELESLRRFTPVEDHPAIDRLWLRLIGFGLGDGGRSLDLPTINTPGEEADPTAESDAAAMAAATIRFDALLAAAVYFGFTGAEPFVVPALNDLEPRIRRMAWLLLGHLDPVSGHIIETANEPREVVEAMLWAALETNPDQIQPLLDHARSLERPSPVVAYLLSRNGGGGSETESEDVAPAVRLLNDWADGDEGDPIYAWLEALAQPGGGPPTAASELPDHITAWFGFDADDRRSDSDPASESDNALNAPSTAAEADRGRFLTLARWRTWRRCEESKPLESLKLLDGNEDLRALIDPPVARDGSVWAAILLAERMLSREAGTELAERWRPSLDSDVRRAGFLLSGLLDSKGNEREGENEEVGEPDFTDHRPRPESDEVAARLARLIRECRQRGASDQNDDSDQHNSSDRLLAWRMIETPEQPVGKDLDVLLALLAAGDVNNNDAADLILSPGSGAGGDTTHGSAQRLMRFAWLIERFLPESYSAVEPLFPWNDDIAAFQLDIMGALIMRFPAAALFRAIELRSAVVAFANAHLPPKKETGRAPETVEDSSDRQSPMHGRIE